MLVALVLSLALIATATTTTMYKVNTAAAQQQQQQPPTPFTTATWTTSNTKTSAVTMPEEEHGQFVQVSWWSDAWDIGKSIVKSGVGQKAVSVVKSYFTKETNAVPEIVQQAKRIAGNAIQETKSLCTTAASYYAQAKSLCTTVNKVQGFAQQGINQLPGSAQQQQPQQLGVLPPGQQQLNPNVRDHRTTDTVETGREPVLLPSAQPPTPQAALVPTTPNQQRLQLSLMSIKINNDHDPNSFGVQNDGEWKIGVLVNGQFRDLSPPGSPLGDARGGRTYSLSNIQPIVLNVDKSRGAVVISTIGQEIDGCNFKFDIPPSVIKAGMAVTAIYTGGATAPVSAASSAVGNNPNIVLPAYQAQLKVAQGVINQFCAKFNPNDAIGTISDTYGPSTFGVGSHSTLSTPVSDSGRDFVLTYQIKTLQ
jgi:hypothetical protein